MSKLIIFDLDSIIFTVGWRYRAKKAKTAKNLVKLNTNKFVSDVLRKTNVDDYLGFYGAQVDEDNYKPNFRYTIDPNYKANRPSTPDFIKEWRPTIHEVFKEAWGFQAVDGMEADDAVAIAVEKYKNNYDEIFVATFDKDLKQIPNTTFYNMKKHVTENITKDIANKYFYTQVLTGDSSDNIPGLKGIGPAKAKKILKDCVSEYSLFRTTALAYKQKAEEAYNKELANITTNIIAELDDVNVDTSQSEYTNLSDAKLQRKIRINSKALLKTYMEEYMPGGWKTYYKQQFSLLRLLIKENDDITIPAVQKNPMKLSEEDLTEKIAAITSSNLDDFLTI